MGDSRTMADDEVPLTPQRSSERIEVNINHADEVKHANTINETTVRRESSKATGPIERNGEVEDIQEAVPCRKSRICCIHGPRIKREFKKVVIANNINKIDICISKEAAEFLSRNEINVEDTIMGCITRLNWNGEELLEKCQTAFTTADRMETNSLNKLLKDVLCTVYNDPTHDKIMELVQTLLDKFEAKLVLMRRGSLQFVLQHQSVEAAERVLHSLDKQREIQKVLMDFLPDWVPSADIQWTVSDYRLTEQDQQVTSESPVTLLMYTTETEGTEVDAATELLLGKIVESVTERHVRKAMENLQNQVVQAICSAVDELKSWTGRLQREHSSAAELEPERPQESSDALIGLPPFGDVDSEQHVELETRGTIVVQASSGDGGTPSVMSPGGDIHSNIAATEYGQHMIAQEDDEGRDKQVQFGSEGDQHVTEQMGELFGKPTSNIVSPGHRDSVDHPETHVEDTEMVHKNYSDPLLSQKGNSQFLNEQPDVREKASIFLYQSPERPPQQVATVAQADTYVPPGQPLGLTQIRQKGGESMSSGFLSSHPTSDGFNRKHTSTHSADCSARFAGLEEIHEKLRQPYEKLEKSVSKHSPRSGKSDVDETTDEDRKGHSDDESDGSKGAQGLGDRGQPSGSDRGQKTSETRSTKTEEEITLQAEQLLNWVNVKSKASQSKDPEIQRMMDQVKHSLIDEEDPAPKARALDTVLVLDTSDSVVNTHLDELKTVAHTFIDGIEEIVDTMNLEENLAVIQMGDRAWVRQHLTNDYARVRDVIDEMTPDSKEMKTGGRTPIFQALMVCLGAIEGRGGVVNVAGCHRVRPRIIFFSDGRPTDEATEHGSDVQSNVNEVKFALVQLISEFASKKHKTTPTPIFWVPVGRDPDHPFLKSLAALSGGKVVEPGKVNELCRYYKVQETIGCVFKMVKKHTDVYQTDQQMKSIIEALAGNLEEEEKNYIMEEVRKKQKEPDSEPGEADDFDNVFEDKELVESGSLPPLGTRVVRGKDWKWNNQDTEGPGTVIQHRKKRDSWLHIMWDNGTHNAYRYGDGDFYDVKITQDYPRQIGSSELIEIGVVVRRGDDWKDGEEDGNETGVVIRKRKDGKVKVRWANGHIGKYRFGADGKFEVRVVDPPEAAPHQQAEEAAAAQREPEELQGAVGGYDPSEGESRRVWYWKDGSTKEWHMYSHTDQEKLKQAYARRKDGSCVINREGKNRRVLFKTNQEKTVDKGLMHEVDSKIMSEREYRRRQGLDSDDHEREQPLAASVGHEFMLGKGAEPSFRMPPGKDWKVKSPPPGQEWKGESSSDSGHGKSSFPQQQSKPQIPELRTQTRHQEKHEERGDSAGSDDATSKHMPRNVRDADPTRQEQS